LFENDNPLLERELQTETPSRLARAEARWAQAAAEQPSLARAFALQRRTIGRQLGLLDELIRGHEPLSVPSEVSVLLRLSDSLPALRGTIGPLPVEQLAEVMSQLAGDVAAVTGYAAASRIGEALNGGSLDPARLLAIAYQRDERAIRQLASEHALVPDVLWLVADMAVAPVLHLQQQAVFREREPESPVREALDRWDQGYCPACGSWPAMAELFAGARLLRCACCAAAWQLHSDRCTYCGQAGAQYRTVTPEAQRPGRQLELCRACGGFLKRLDVAAPTPFPLLAIEDLASSDLDRAALTHGFRRLPLPTLHG
jgi:FdhE protein